MNGVDVSACSHEEAVSILTRASEPIMVQVKHRDSPTSTSTPTSSEKTNSNTTTTSDKSSSNTSSSDTSDSNRTGEVTKWSREMHTQTESEPGASICDECGDLYSSYYNYQCDTDQCLYPDLHYEVWRITPLTI